MGGSARLALALALLAVAPAAASPEMVVYAEWSGRFLAGLYAVGVGAPDDGDPVPPSGVGAVNLHRARVAVNACHRALVADVHWVPSNASAGADGNEAVLRHEMHVELFDPAGARVAARPVPRPAWSVPLGTVEAAGGHRVDLYLRTGADVDWTLRLRGFRAVGEPACEENVRVVEVEANPAGADAGNEWVELANEGLFDVNLEGWRLRATHGMPAELVLGPLVLAPGAREVVVFPTQFLDNEDEVVVLEDPWGERDRTPALGDSANDARTWQRGADGAWAFAPGTPGAP